MSMGMIEGGWAYVWPAYGLALIVLGALSLAVWLNARRWSRAESQMALKESEEP
jgi:heme exporter protein CcmD